MRKTIKHFLGGAAFFLFLPAATNCQNLLANGGFERPNTCTEYTAQCSPAAWFMVIPPAAKAPGAKEGVHALPFTYDNVYTPLGQGRSFPYTRILCPLLPGKEYNLSCWLHTGDFAFSHLEVVLSGADPTRARFAVGKTRPTLTLTKGDIVRQEKDGWFQLQRKFTVETEMNFILLGNLIVSDPYSHHIEHRYEANSGNIFFFMDDIRLSATETSLNSCPLYAVNREALYAEHHRHTKHLYLDTLPPVVAPPPVVPDTPAIVGRVSPSADTLLIPGVFFATNSSTINIYYHGVLDSVILRIRKKTPAKIEINGYTDNSGSETFNNGLSLRRAESIRSYIVSKFPLLQTVSGIHGYGMGKPIAPNDNPGGKAKNRRVEIILVY